jgi:hypothetical protein
VGQDSAEAVADSVALQSRFGAEVQGDPAADDSRRAEFSAAVAAQVDGAVAGGAWAGKR